jgi:hypothetical protein
MGLSLMPIMMTAAFAGLGMASDDMFQICSIIVFVSYEF